MGSSKNSMTLFYSLTSAPYLDGLRRHLEGESIIICCFDLSPRTPGENETINSHFISYSIWIGQVTPTLPFV